MPRPRTSPFSPGWLRLGLALCLASLAALLAQLIAPGGALSVFDAEQRGLPLWLAAQGESFARLLTGRWPSAGELPWLWGGGLLAGVLAALRQLGIKQGLEALLLCACAGLLLRLHGPRPAELAGLWPLAFGTGLILLAERSRPAALWLELAAGWLLLAGLAEAQRHGLWTSLGALLAVALVLGQRALPRPAEHTGSSIGL